MSRVDTAPPTGPERRGAPASDAAPASRLSVVVANYNYGAYVGAAVESALEQDWPDVEVVVVDDGSTDSSPAVVEGYAGRARVLLTENRGQRTAVNRGFALTTGDVVVFLDSDDVLPRDFARRVMAAWRPGVSKVQTQMLRMTPDGATYGDPFPTFAPVPSPDDIRAWFSLTSAYPTPPGSGNAYARGFLERIFPLDETAGDAPDSACLAAAPLFGEVVSLPGVLVGYRQHEGNDSYVLADHRRFAREVDRARARWAFAHRAAYGSLPVDERPLYRSREVLQFRTAAGRVDPSAPLLAGDGRRRRFLDILRSPAWPGPERRRSRLALVGWLLALELGPRLLVPTLLRLRWGRPSVSSGPSGGAR